MWTMVFAYYLFSPVGTTSQVSNLNLVYTPGFSSLATCQAAGAAISSGISIVYSGANQVVARGTCIQVN